MAMAAESFEEVRSAISVGKAAGELGVSPGTIRNWVDKGYIRAIQLPSGHRRIPEVELEGLLGRMFDFGVPEEEPTTPLVRAESVNPDEEWGP